MAHLLGAESVSLEYPSRSIFDSLTIGVAEGDRIGIVGRNGEGKSTLLQILAGRVSPDSGKVTSQRGLHIGMLDQGDTLNPQLSVMAAVVGTLDEHEWASIPRTRDVLEGLLGDIDWKASISELSGGQRRRVALAALLVGDHDVMFLDEPTNHLDMEGIAWLSQHLHDRWSANAGALLVVTHDRWFLDAVCTTTWEVHDETIDVYEGGYAAYVLQRVERDRMAASSEAKRQNLMRKELAWLRRGPPARTSKPKFRIDAANALIADDPPTRDTVALYQMATSRLGKDVVDLLDVSVSFGATEVLKNVEWRIAPGERAGILGVNGAGKSTLLNLITGALQPTSGRVKRGKTVKVATLTQHSTELDSVANDLVRNVITRQRSSVVVGKKEMTTAQLLEQLGFSNRHLSSPIKELSGGQKRRLNLLLILLNEPNVLVLDEPSNDLDTEMLAAMEDLLDSWPGTLLVVSHDRYLMERVTDQQYAIVDGKFTHLPGGVDQYLGAQSSDKGQTGNATSLSVASPNAKATNADQRAASKELASLERKLAKVHTQIRQSQTRIEAHDPMDYQALAKLSEELQAFQRKQSDLEDRWLELSD